MYRKWLVTGPCACVFPKISTKEDLLHAIKLFIVTNDFITLSWLNLLYIVQQKLLTISPCKVDFAYLLISSKCLSLVTLSSSFSFERYKTN